MDQTSVKSKKKHRKHRSAKKTKRDDAAASNERKWKPIFPAAEDDSEHNTVAKSTRAVAKRVRKRPTRRGGNVRATRINSNDAPDLSVLVAEANAPQAQKAKEERRRLRRLKKNAAAAAASSSTATTATAPNDVANSANDTRSNGHRHRGPLNPPSQPQTSTVSSRRHGTSTGNATERHLKPKKHSHTAQQRRSSLDKTTGQSGDIETSLSKLHARSNHSPAENHQQSAAGYSVRSLAAIYAGKTPVKETNLVQLLSEPQSLMPPGPPLGMSPGQPRRRVNRKDLDASVHSQQSRQSQKSIRSTSSAQSGTLHQEYTGKLPDMSDDGDNGDDFLVPKQRTSLRNLFSKKKTKQATNSVYSHIPREKYDMDDSDHNEKPDVDIAETIVRDKGKSAETKPPGRKSVSSLRNLFGGSSHPRDKSSRNGDASRDGREPSLPSKPKPVATSKYATIAKPPPNITATAPGVPSRPSSFRGINSSASIASVSEIVELSGEQTQLQPVDRVPTLSSGNKKSKKTKDSVSESSNGYGAPVRKKSSSVSSSDNDLASNNISRRKKDIKKPSSRRRIMIPSVVSPTPSVKKKIEHKSRSSVKTLKSMFEKHDGSNMSLASSSHHSTTSNRSHASQANNKNNNSNINLASLTLSTQSHKKNKVNAVGLRATMRRGSMPLDSLSHHSKSGPHNDKRNKKDKSRKTEKNGRCKKEKTRHRLSSNGICMTADADEKKLKRGSTSKFSSTSRKIKLKRSKKSDSDGDCGDDDDLSSAVASLSVAGTTTTTTTAASKSKPKSKKDGGTATKNNSATITAEKSVKTNKKKASSRQKLNDGQQKDKKGKSDKESTELTTDVDLSEGRIESINTEPVSSASGSSSRKDEADDDVGACSSGSGTQEGEQTTKTRSKARSKGRKRPKKSKQKTRKKSTTRNEEKSATATGTSATDNARDTVKNAFEGAPPDGQSEKGSDGSVSTDGSRNTSDEGDAFEDLKIDPASTRESGAAYASAFNDDGNGVGSSNIAPARVRPQRTGQTQRRISRNLDETAFYGLDAEEPQTPRKATGDSIDTVGGDTPGDDEIIGFENEPILGLGVMSPGQRRQVLPPSYLGPGRRRSFSKSPRTPGGGVPKPVTKVSFEFPVPPEQAAMGAKGIEIMVDIVTHDDMSSLASMTERSVDSDDTPQTRMDNMVKRWTAMDDDEDGGGGVPDTGQDMDKPVRLSDNVLDNVVLVAPDLDDAMNDFENRTGVRPVPLGALQGTGARTAVVVLNDNRYVEIVAPDRDGPEGALGAYLEKLPHGSLEPFHYAVRTQMSKMVEGYVSEVLGWKPDQVAMVQGGGGEDGGVRQWDLMTFVGHDVGGCAPSYIKWKDTSHHPTARRAPVAALDSLHIQAPEGHVVHKLLSGVDGIVPRTGNGLMLCLTLKTPKGKCVFIGMDPPGYKFGSYEEMLQRPKHAGFPGMPELLSTEGNYSDEDWDQKSAESVSSSSSSSSSSSLSTTSSSTVL